MNILSSKKIFSVVACIFVIISCKPSVGGNNLGAGYASFGAATGSDNSFLSNAGNEAVTPGNDSGIFDGSTQIRTVWRYKLTAKAALKCTGELRIGVKVPFEPIVEMDTIKCLGFKIDVSKYLKGLSNLSSNNSAPQADFEDIVKIDRGIIYVNNLAGMQASSAGIPAAPSIFTKTNSELNGLPKIAKTLSISIAGQSPQQASIGLEVEEAGTQINGQEDSVKWNIQPIFGNTSLKIKMLEKLTIAISKKNLNIPHLSIEGDISSIFPDAFKGGLVNDLVTLFTGNKVKISLDLIGKIEE